MNSLSAEQYTDALRSLGLTPYSAPQFLGIGLRQSMRFAAGDYPVSETVALLLAMYRRYGIPREFAASLSA